MPAQFWETNLNSPGATSAGTALLNSTTLTDVSSAPQLVLPANYLYAGQRLRLTAFGTYSNTGTPTLLLGFYYGGVAGAAICASSAFTTTTAATNWAWRMEATVIVRSIGTTGTLLGQGVLLNPTSLTAASAIPIPATALANVTVDTTTAKAITVGAQWGAASASNTLTCHDLIVEVLN